MRGVRGGHAEPRMLTEAERRDALLSAAERVFLAKGYVSTTMADIAQAAGMSKKTIYQVFDSKKELFDALMMDRITVLKMPAEDADRPPAVILRAVLLEISRFVLAPKQIALTRLILAEIASTPEVGDVMKTRCVQVETMMQNWLALQISRGVFDIPDIHVVRHRLRGFSLAPPAAARRGAVGGRARRPNRANGGGLRARVRGGAVYGRRR
jgi:TetR/AcrR family transcriptional regulator of autoinduction and epiphytic fitness